MREPTSAVRTATGLVLAVAVLAACGTPPHKTAPTVNPPAGRPSPSPSSVYRAGTMGQPFDIPGWRVTVTGQQCGPTADLIRSSLTIVMTGRACVVSLVAVNTGGQPAAFNQHEQVDVWSAAGFDPAGNMYTPETWSLTAVNPLVTEPRQQLMFGVADGVTLTKVAINDVVVAL